jgi:hypothetical protein
MVKCDIGDSESPLGLKRFDIVIDADKGLEPADVDYVVAFPSGPEVFAGRPVQVNVYDPSTTDRDLLDARKGCRRTPRWVEYSFRLERPRAAKGLATRPQRVPQRAERTPRLVVRVFVAFGFGAL